MPGKARVASPEVLATAAKYQVDLSAVRATGADDRITSADVFRAAVAAQIGLSASSTEAEVAAGLDTLFAARKRREVTATPTEPAAQPQPARPLPAGPAWALNPRVDQVRAEVAAGRATLPAAAAPGLFASGDLPAFTASGIPPSALLDVPTAARHAMAAAPTMAEAYAIGSECTGPDAAQTASIQYGGHPGNADYAARVQQWQVEAMTDGQLHDSLVPGASDEINRRAAALPVDLPADETKILDALTQNELR